jgi:hypothetical protein
MENVGSLGKGGKRVVWRSGVEKKTKKNKINQRSTIKKS